MIWLPSIVIAAILFALMDSCENEHYFNTIFSNLNPNFWYKRQSWDKAKKIAGWKFDAWHVAKTLMLCFWILAIVTYKEIWTKWVDYAVGGIVFIVVFNIFYDVIFKKK